MTKIDLSSFKSLYITTARDYIKKLRQNLEILLKHPNNHDAISTIYISSHSLGSQSTLIGYKNIESVCGVIEQTFKKIKEGKANVSQELLISLKDALTSLTNCIDSIEKANTEIDLSGIKNQLDKIEL